MKKEYANLVVFHSIKEDGNMMIHYSNRGSYVQNVSQFMERSNVDLKKCLYLSPFQKDVVVELDESYVVHGDIVNPRVIQADGLICQFSDVFLYTTFSDELPFVLYDSKQKIFAFAHLGWESIYLNLHEKLGNMMVENYHCDVDDMMVIIGPCIKKESYIVDDPVQLHNPKWFDFTFEKGDRFSVDLVGYVLRYFLEMGFSLEQFHIHDSDTYQDEQYFSYHLGKENDKKYCQAFIYGAGIVGE